MGRPSGNRKEARLSVSLDGQDYEQLRAIAQRRDVSVAWVVRQAVHTLIAQEPDEGPGLPAARRNRRATRPAP